MFVETLCLLRNLDSVVDTCMQHDHAAFSIVLTMMMLMTIVVVVVVVVMLNMFG